MPTLRDDRGAIMVLGIFMCTAMVGAIWYLAGIGDAIIYRERLQETADAVAFTDAALHARGMHLIVLINIVMACILGIRVALKIAQFILGVAAAAFTGLGFVFEPFWAAIPPCVEGIAKLQEIIDNTRTPIDKSLEALSHAQSAMGKVIPSAAMAGAYSVGSSYKPAVSGATVVRVPLTEALPISEGSPEKLCKEAGRKVGEVFGVILSKVGLGGGGRVKDWLSSGAADLAKASPDYFCELGTKGNAPNVDAMYQEAATERCKHQPETEQRKYDAAEASWQKACAEHGVTCRGRGDDGEILEHGQQTGTPSREAQSRLDILRYDRDASARALKEYQTLVATGGFVNSCEAWAVSDMKRRHAEQEEAAKKNAGSEGSPGTSQNKTPKRVMDQWHNGAPAGQIVALAIGDASRLRPSSRLVRVARNDAFASEDESPREAFVPVLAQAEYFYDCVGPWAACNGDEEAMWHFRWRARLRRFNEPRPWLELVGTVINGAGAAKLGTEMVTTTIESGGGALQSAPLRLELLRALREEHVKTRGIH